MGYLEKIQNLFGFKGEKPPQYDQAAYRWNQYGLTPWIINREFQAIDYRGEVGKLADSSLVMPIVNDTGIAIAEASPAVRKRNAKGKWEPVPEHPMAELIENPNPFTTWDEYCGALSLDWWIDGNVYFYMVRDATGKVIELWWLPSFLVEPRWPGDGRAPEALPGNPFLSCYQYNVPSKEPVLYPVEDVVHLKRFTDPCDVRRGIGAFGPVIKEILGDNAVATFSATLMRNMGMVPYLLAPKEREIGFGETEANAIKDTWMAKTRGANIGLPLVNAIPLEVTKLGLNPTELDVSGLSRRFETRIAAVSRYPAPYLQFLAGLENGTSYASYKQAREQAYEQVVIPIQRAIGKQLTRKLLPQIDPAKGLQFYFDTSEVRVLQEDRDALYKREVLALSQGGVSRNEFAKALGKEPPDAEEIYYIPGTVTPMTQELIEETAKEKPEPPPAAPVPTDPKTMKRLADVDHWFEGLEVQMKEFVQK